MEPSDPLQALLDDRFPLAPQHSPREVDRAGWLQFVRSTRDHFVLAARLVLAYLVRRLPTSTKVGLYKWAGPEAAIGVIWLLVLVARARRERRGTPPARPTSWRLPASGSSALTRLLAPGSRARYRAGWFGRYPSGKPAAADERGETT